MQNTRPDRREKNKNTKAQTKLAIFNTKYFKSTNLKISFKTENKINELLTQNKNKNTRFNNFKKAVFIN